MSKDGGPAFPLATGSVETTSDRGQKIVVVRELDRGMSLRDYFAAHAPQPPKTWQGGEWERYGANALSSYIEWRWYYADAMLTERAK